MSYLINFDDYDHPFCEANIYGQPPEYFNSYSSLFLTFIGCYAMTINRPFLFESNYDSAKYNDIFMLYASLTINGLMSFLYHYTNWIGWGLMDRFSMVLIATYSFNSFTNALYTFDLCQPFYNLVRLFQISYLTILLTITGLHNEHLFNILFGIFLLGLIIFMFQITFSRQRNYISQEIIFYGWKGVLLIYLAGITWIITENLCNEFFIMKYLMGHTFWHFGVGLGGYYISLVLLALFSRDKITNIEHKFKLPYLKFYKNY